MLTDPDGPSALEPGEILVAPITDPSWAPLFVAAGAVVVDVGALSLARRDRQPGAGSPVRRLGHRGNRPGSRTAP
nr:PEP-utilizing enzyme [Pseudonocardia abyssalis]